MTIQHEGGRSVVPGGLRELASSVKDPAQRVPPDSLPDGLYQVTTSYLCAGFVIQAGQVTRCAPILRRRLSWWQTRARWVGP